MLRSHAGGHTVRLAGVVRLLVARERQKDVAMEIQQVRVKVMARSPDVTLDAVIPVFHDWIRQGRLGNQLLIDVADYRHVPNGPGVMLIGHEAHYSLDRIGGRFGLSYARKRDAIGPARPRLREALQAALDACAALEAETALDGELRFEPGKLHIHIMSRLIAPNHPETLQAIKPILADLLATVYDGADIALRHLDDPRQPFGVAVEAAGTIDLAHARERIAAAQ